MKIKKLCTVAALSALFGGAYLSVSMYNPSEVHAAPPVDEIVDDSGDRVFMGEPSARVEAINQQLSEPISASPGIYAGYSFTSDSQRLEVYATDTGAAQELRDIVGEDFDSYVSIIEVPYSNSQLTDAKDDAVGIFEEDSSLRSVSLDERNGSLEVGIEPTSEAQRQAFTDSPAPGEAPIDASLQEKLEGISTRTGIDVELTTISEGEDSTNRHDDYSPFNMAGRAQSNVAGCTLGWPIEYRGTKYIATAGHCDGESWYNTNGNYIGSRGTSSYPGNADKYGDWMLIRGSGSSRIFDGDGAYSSSYTSISAAAYSPRAEGSQLCMSGSYSNDEICRFRVLETGATVRYEGVTSGYQTITYHDSDLNGSSDCQGFINGDSGAPAYYANGNQPGTVILNGMVKGMHRNVSYNCRYSFTELGGIRAWSTDAYVDR